MAVTESGFPSRTFWTQKTIIIYVVFNIITDFKNYLCVSQNLWLINTCYISIFHNFHCYFKNNINIILGNFVAFKTDSYVRV